MPARRVVRGQQVSRVKVLRAKQLRTEMTPAEAALCQRLRRSQLEGLHFRRQQVIAGFIVDFYCHSAGVIVNVDGGIHAEMAEADTERDMILTAQGFSSMHITNADVLDNMELVLQRIAQACRLAHAQSAAKPERNQAGTPSRLGEGPGVRSL